MFGSAIRRGLSNHLTYVASNKDGDEEEIDFPGYRCFSLEEAFRFGGKNNFLVNGTLEKSDELTIDDKYFWGPKNRWTEIKKVLHLKDKKKELFRVTLLGSYAQEFDQLDPHLESAVVSILNPQVIDRISRNEDETVPLKCLFKAECLLNLVFSSGLMYKKG